MAEAEKEQVELDLGDNQETEVEVEESPNAQEDDSGEDQFQKAESATQKRIDRLTKKMREAERREQEAIKYAQGVQQESNQLKQRIQNLDTNYVSEYSNRVSTQMQQAEAALARAIEVGDSAGTVEAQRALTNLAIQADRAAQAKAQSERARQQQAAAAQHQARQPMPAQQPKRPDKKAEEWALRNSWFGSDEAMTYAAFGIHKKLVEEEGFDPQSDDYYTELDNRIASKFNTGATATNKRPAQTVVGATRNTSGRSGKKVRLTPSQVAIAKKLGVPLEEYAKYVKE
jgi:GH15 family glucan-1,4-alpha-glucosidase